MLSEKQRDGAFNSVYSRGLTQEGMMVSLHTLTCWSQLKLASSVVLGWNFSLHLGVPLQQPSACSVGSESLSHVSQSLEQSETVSSIILVCLFFFFQIMVSIFSNKAFVKNSFYLFIYSLRVRWVFVAVCGLSPVVTSEWSCWVVSDSLRPHGL